MSDTVQARVRQAVVALKQGKLIILTDDQNREHEGDLVGLASFVTPEKINQALAIARGVLAVPMTAERAAALRISADDATEFRKIWDKIYGERRSY